MGKLGAHPHIVGIVESGEDRAGPYIVSEHMPGGDVAGLLAGAERRRLDVAQAVAIAIDVTRALEHAHGCGIVHRDLKPANVWLGDDGRARLGDFGLALTSEGRSRAEPDGTLVGTVAYLPPEQALGRTSDARSDLYSLGALLYEMLTGQPPFPGDDAVAIMGRHLSATPVAPSKLRPELPAALDDLVLELLAKRPEERPASAAEVRRALESIDLTPATAPLVEAEENPLDRLAGGVFVGRERELGELRRAVDEARGGAGGLVLLVGEPGIGKTRTAEELATYARVQRRPGALGALPRGGGRARVLALGRGHPLLRARRRPRRPGLGARRRSRRDRAHRPGAARAGRRGRRARGRRARGGALPALRRRRDVPRGRLALAPAGPRPRRPALGRRAVASAPALPRARLRRQPAADRGHLPRRRARAPPPAGAHAVRARGDRARHARAASRPRRGGGRAIHRDVDGHLARAGAGRRGARADRGQPVLRLRGRPPARRRGQARGRRRGRERVLAAPDPAGRARGRRPPPRPALRRGQWGAHGRRRDRPRVPARRPGARLRGLLGGAGDRGARGSGGGADRRPTPALAATRSPTRSSARRSTPRSRRRGAPPCTTGSPAPSRSSTGTTGGCCRRSRTSSSRRRRPATRCGRRSTRATRRHRRRAGSRTRTPSCCSSGRTTRSTSTAMPGGTCGLRSTWSSARHRPGRRATPTRG